jgi:hypothetical protein
MARVALHLGIKLGIQLRTHRIMVVLHLGINLGI